MTDATVATIPFSGLKKWLAFSVLCGSLSIVMIDDAVLNIAIPDLYRELHTTPTQIQWALAGYILTYTSLLLPVGNLADRYGRRTYLRIGMVVFLVGSVASGLAPSGEFLIASRLLQGVGGGFIMPSTLSILIEVFPKEERTKAIAMWSTASGVTIILGPLLAGWLLAHFWWGSVFIINIPIVVLALFGTLILPNHKDALGERLDIPGILFATIAVACILYAIIESDVGSWLALPPAVVGVVAAVLFVKVERHCEHPMLDLTYLRQRMVWLPLVTIGMVFFTSLGTGFLYAQYLQILQGRTALNAAGVSMVFIGGWTLTSPLIPILITRIKAKGVMSLGMFLNAVSFIILLTIGDNMSIWWMMVSYAIFGIGASMAVTTSTDLVMAHTPEERYGIGSSLNDVARQLPGAFGVAVLGTVAGAVFTRSLRKNGLDHISSIAQGHDKGFSHLSNIAFVDALIVVAGLCVIVCIAVSIAWLFIKEHDTTEAPSQTFDQQQGEQFAALIGCTEHKGTRDKINH